MFDSVGKALDNASQMLAGGENTPGSAGPPAKPEFIRGEVIDPPEEVVGGSLPPNVEAAMDTHHVIEFIHFGHVHPSFSPRFTNQSLEDNKALPPSKLPKKSTPRGIQFRSALERETILLGTFIQATKQVLIERDKNKGALGGALDTLGSMLGAGGGGSGVSKPSDLEPFLTKVTTVAGILNVAVSEYKDIFQSGIDLHQARADYRAFLEKLKKEKPEAGAGGLLGSAMGAVTGAAANVPGPAKVVADILAMAQDIAFKPQQIKMKFFAWLVAQQELQVEKACHGMTLAALKSVDQVSPFLPVWFTFKPGEDPKEEAPPAQEKQYDDNPLGDAERKFDEAKAKVEDAKNSVEDKIKDVKDFFAPPVVPTPPPGTPFLAIAFNTLPPTGKQSDPMPMDLAALACVAFKEALEKDILPEIVKKIVKVIMGISLDLLHSALETCLARDPASPIPEQALYDGARQRLYDKLINLAMEQVSFIDNLKKIHTPTLNKQSVSAGGLIDKGLDEGFGKVKTLIDDKIGQFLDIPLKIAMGAFASQLEDARKQGMAEKGHTMECYLGRLPWMEATLFFNLFFPFWDALMDVLTGVMGSALSGPLGAIRSAAGKAKDLTDTARDLKAKADKAEQKLYAAKDALGQGMNQTQMAAAALGAGAQKDDVMNTNAEETKAPESKPESAGDFKYPIEGRLNQGEGKKIEGSVIEEFDNGKKWKWDDAKEPPAPPKDAAKASTSA